MLILIIADCLPGTAPNPATVPTSLFNSIAVYPKFSLPPFLVTTLIGTRILSSATLIDEIDVSKNGNLKVLFGNDNNLYFITNTDIYSLSTASLGGNELPLRIGQLTGFSSFENLFYFL